MITLFRQLESRQADEIQSRLNEMVAAHQVRPAEDFDGPREDLPVIDDSGDRYSGTSIEPFLRKVEGELKISRQISADACYVDPNTGETC